MGPSKSKHKFISFLLSLTFVLISFLHCSVATSSELVTATISPLIPQIKQKIRQYPSLVCGVYIKPSWTETSININGEAQFPAASLIKIPVAVVLLRNIDKGLIKWDTVLTLKPKHYAQGAGYLRTKRAGTKLELREVFKLMITISDNTATNMIIDLLGGINKVNQEILKLGLKNTRLVNYLCDFKGTNKTSPHDLAELFEKSLEGELLSSNSRKIFKNTLLKVKNKSLIKKGLGKFTKFAHKTGTIGICVGDAGIVYLPLWKRVTISIIVRRPFNSLQGQRII